MKDGSLNKKRYELRAFIRPSLKGASLSAQRKALVAAGVDADFIYEDWEEVKENSRPGDIIALYDLFYLGTSNRMIVDRWQWIVENGRTIDLIREKDLVLEKYWLWAFGLYKRTIEGVGKDRIGKAQEKTGGRTEAFEEERYRKAFDLWNEQIEGKISIETASRICGVTPATFYTWAEKYLVRFLNGEVPHDPIPKSRLSYMRDRRGIKKNKEGIYYRSKPYYKK